MKECKESSRRIQDRESSAGQIPHIKEKKKRRFVKAAIIDHAYTDYSRFQTSEGEKCSKNNANFPQKLHLVLSRQEYQHIICWMPHGRSWRVLNKELLASVVCKNEFKHSKFESFTRQVNGWGFKRLFRPGPDYKSYYHELFLRGLPDLVGLMHRLEKPGKRLPNKLEEPDLYDISRKFPLPEYVPNCSAAATINLPSCSNLFPRCQINSTALTCNNEIEKGTQAKEERISSIDGIDRSNGPRSFDTFDCVNDGTLERSSLFTLTEPQELSKKAPVRKYSCSSAGQSNDLDLNNGGKLHSPISYPPFQTHANTPLYYWGISDQAFTRHRDCKTYPSYNATYRQMESDDCFSHYHGDTTRQQNDHETNEFDPTYARDYSHSFQFDHKEVQRHGDLQAQNCPNESYHRHHHQPITQTHQELNVWNGTHYSHHPTCPPPDQSFSSHGFYHPGAPSYHSYHPPAYQHIMHSHHQPVHSYYSHTDVQTPSFNRTEVVTKSEESEKTQFSSQASNDFLDALFEFDESSIN